MWHAVPSMKSRLHCIHTAAPRILYAFIKLYVVSLNWLSCHHVLKGCTGESLKSAKAVSGEIRMAS